MARGQPVVRVHGLRELTRAMRDADRAVWKELRAEFKTVGDWMASEASARARANPAAAKTLAPTFKGKGDRMGALVQFGGRGGEGRAHMAGPGWEYGSKDPRDQFKNPSVSVKRQSPLAGHYLGAALKANTDELEERAFEAIDNFWDRLASDVNRASGQVLG